MQSILFMVVVALLALAGPGCAQYSSSQGATAQVTRPDPVEAGLLMQIEIDTTSPLNEPLKMRWKISNTGAKTEYVYSTLLRPENNALVEIVIDSDRRTTEVRFLRLPPFPRDISPNSFPETHFLQLSPGQFTEGSFVSSKPVNQLVNTELVSADPLQEAVTGRLTPGAWEIRSLIAYGEEIESVQHDLKTLYPHSIGHPLAAIVKWQKVAYSAPVGVTFHE